MMSKVNLANKLAQFSDYWNPRIIGELNGQQVKIAKLKGDFVWHSHANEDELFMVIEGELIIELRDKKIQLSAGEFYIVPAGVEHRPIAREEVSVLLFEPNSTLNTGDVNSDLTRNRLEWL